MRWFFTLITLFFTINSFAQFTNVKAEPKIISTLSYTSELFKTDKIEFTKGYYLKKSKQQKKLGYSLIASGTIMIFSGIISATKISGGEECGTSNRDAPALILVGVSSSLISIPFFLNAHRNKMKAKALP